jgi:hypothetical protein
MDSGKLIKSISTLYGIARPILMVMFIAAIIVFFNSYPNVPEIADETKDYRQQVINRATENETIADNIDIKPPSAPSLPNTIAPVITPEEVNELANPKPETKPKVNETTGTTEETKTKEPPLEIKLFTGFLNVAPLILIAALGGFGIYLLFKNKKHMTLQSMFGVAIALVVVCSLVFFGAIVVNFFEYLYETSVNSDLALGFIIPVSAIVGVWLSYGVVAKKTTIFRRNMGLAFAGALMGAFLASFLPFWIIFILLIAIALFDIYSVKYGPIKKIMELEKQNSKKRATSKDESTTKKKVEKVVLYRTLETHNKTSSTNKVTTKDKNHSSIEKNATAKSNPGTSKLKKPKSQDDEFDLILMYDNPDWSLGLGDFVIYSMFTSAVLTYTLLYIPYYIFYTPAIGLILPWVIFIICALGLLVGFFVTLRLLEKHEYLPGLPITIGCGFLVFIICILVLQGINYLFYNEFAIII